jgi:hypothetical protein
LTNDLLEVVLSVGIGRVVENTQGLGNCTALPATAGSLQEKIGLKKPDK